MQCKPRTLAIRRTVIANHIVPAMGKVALAAVRPEHAIELHQRMAGIPAQANIAIATLSHIFGKAQVWGLVEDGENPCLSVTRYRSRKRERFLTEAEFARPRGGCCRRPRRSAAPRPRRLRPSGC